MARPVKEGLDYFPMDVDFLHNIKVRKIMRSNGPQSPVVLLALLGSIYGDHGYYMEWDDDVRFLVADDIGISEEAVDEVIKKAVKVNFFDKTIFEKFSVLTSRGIQKRYLQASKRKKDSGIQKRFCLLVNVSNNSVNADNNPAQRELMHTETDKVNKSKVNKTKTNTVRAREDPRDEIRSDFMTNVWPLFPRQSGFDDTYNLYYQAILEGPEVKQAIIQKLKDYRKYLEINQIGQRYTKGSKGWLEERLWTANYDLTPPNDSRGTTASSRKNGSFSDADIPF